MCKLSLTLLDTLHLNIAAVLGSSNSSILIFFTLSSSPSGPLDLVDLGMFRAVRRCWNISHPDGGVGCRVSSHLLLGICDDVLG